MPYTLDKPPDRIKGLPKHAKEIWINAFNAAHKQYEGDEEKANQTAWAAVKTKYEQDKDGNWKLKKAKAADLSLDDIRRLVSKKLRELYPNKNDGEIHSGPYVEEVFQTYIIYQFDEKYYKRGYTIHEGGVLLTDPVEVEQEWTVKTSELIMQLAKPLDPEGTSWNVVICTPGLTLHDFPWYLSEDLLKNADTAQVFEGVDVNLYELKLGGLASHTPDALFDTKTLFAKNKVGWLEKVKYQAGKGLTAVLNFLDSYKWIGKNLIEAAKKGAEAYGLSFDAPVKAVHGSVDGEKARKVLEFLKDDSNSVDLVSRPAAGGRFIRALASMPNKNAKEDRVMKEKLLKLIKEKRPKLLEGKDEASLSEEEVIALAQAALDEPEKPANNPEDPPKEEEPSEVQILRCEITLRDTLRDADLPELAQKRIQRMFGGKVFKDEELRQAIADEKDYLAKFAQAQGIDLGDQTRPAIEVGTNEIRRMQLALDKMFGLDVGDEGKDVPPFQGILDAYIHYSGDPEVSGRFNASRLPVAAVRAVADFTSTTFTYALANTLNRRLMKDYRAADYREDLLISNKVSAKDFKQQQPLRLGYFGDLDDVDPETANYEEIAAYGDEKAYYTPGQKGNLVTVTRKHIKNDDVGTVRRILPRLGRSARRTHARFIWNFWISNTPTTYDSKAWFHADHGNLGSVALAVSAAGYAALEAAVLALANMTEPDSDETLGLNFAALNVTLEVPNALWAIARQINQARYKDSEFTPNPLFQAFGANNERIHVNPILSDTNDWGLVGDKNDMDILEMAYIDGKEEPEFFIADQPTVGEMFKADKLQYKIRHEYGGHELDHRNVYKSVVAA